MAIHGIGQYSQYASLYRKNVMSEADTSAAEVVNAKPEVSADVEQKGSSLSQNEVAGSDVDFNKAPKKSNPLDFTFDFKKNNNYNLVAATNDTEDIDVNKELDNMQKDTVLDQYKFFVSEANLGTDQDETVRLK